MFWFFLPHMVRLTFSREFLDERLEHHHDFQLLKLAKLEVDAALVFCWYHDAQI